MKLVSDYERKKSKIRNKKVEQYTYILNKFLITLLMGICISLLFHFFLK